MHELSIAESICRSVKECVGNAHVGEMVVQVGVLSGVNRESLDFCLGEAARMAGITLDRFSVERVAAQATCECGHTYEPADLMEPCPECGGYSRAISGAEDVVVSKLVLVVDDEQANQDPG